MDQETFLTVRLQKITYNSNKDASKGKKMIEIFSKPIDPRETKNFHIDNVLERIKDRKNLDRDIQKLPKLPLTACNVCGGSNRNVVFNTNGDDWVQCSNCRHIYKASIPSPLHLEKFFKESTVEVYLDESGFEYRIQNITKPKYEFMMDQYSGEKGRWLDLATGLGDMPFFCSR